MRAGTGGQIPKDMTQCQDKTKDDSCQNDSGQEIHRNSFLPEGVKFLLP
jgi:hypothetical protein